MDSAQNPLAIVTRWAGLSSASRLIDIAIRVGPNSMKIRLMTPAMEYFKQDPCMISMLRAPVPHGNTILVDLFKATNPPEMSKTAAEDAVIATITRSGEIYMNAGITATAPEKLPRQVKDLLAKAPKENKNVVYVKADMWTEYSKVEELVDNLRAVGIEKIVLLTEGGGSNVPAPGGAYRVGGGVSAPVPIYRPNPEHSKEAIDAKFEGDVVLSVVVDEKGNPRELKVIRPLGMGLDEKAIETAQKWKFRPGMKNGHPVPVQGTITVNFRLH